VSDLTPAAMAWLATHHGVITTASLRSCGVGRSTTDRLVRAGVLLNPHKGVYVLASVASSLEVRCAVLCAVHPSGFVTGPTAGTMLDLRRLPRFSGIHFAVRHGLRLDPEPGVVFRQTTALSESHRMVRADGIVVAKPKRIGFDLAADLSALDHLSVLHQLLDRNLVTYDEMVAVGVELCHPARRGSKRYKESLARLGGSAPAQSHPEVVLAEALARRAVPVERQTRVVRVGGRLARIDLAVPEIKWGIELDIHPEHRTIDGQAGDARRYRSLHLAAWQIEPVTELDMLDPESIADELTELYRARRRQFDGRPRVS
jgi:hypothetical protein